MENESEHLQLNPTLHHQYKSLSYSTINIPKPPINNQREQQYAWSFNSHFTSKNEAISISSNINHIDITPVCSDNEQDTEYNDDDDDDINNDDEYNEDDDDTEYQSVTPGIKRWYMSFPDDTSTANNNNNNNDNNKANNNDNNNSLNHSFEVPITMDFCYENLQQQETDIFSSKNLSFNKIHNRLHEGNKINDGDEAITMMGYEYDHNLRFNENMLYIPGQFQSNIYSEGNIGNIMSMNSDDDSIYNEGDGFTENTMNFNDNKELKGITLMGHVQTDDIEIDTDNDDEDMMFIDDNKKNITLMGDTHDSSYKISFGLKSEDKLKGNEEKKVGITLMGHFDDNLDDII